MRTLAIVALLAASVLAGCAAPNPAGYLAEAQKLTGSASGRAGTVASLATNKCEEAAAPQQTRAIVGVQLATRFFQAGRIDAATFEQVIAAGREARDALALACQGRRDDVDQAQLDRGSAAVERIRKLLGGQ